MKLLTNSNTFASYDRERIQLLICKKLNDLDVIIFKERERKYAKIILLYFTWDSWLIRKYFKVLYECELEREFLNQLLIMTKNIDSSSIHLDRIDSFYLFRETKKIMEKIND